MLALLNQHLQQNIIERAHRRGSLTEGRKPPVVVNFLSFKVKDSLRGMVHKLKGSIILISDDFSPVFRLTRKKLLKFARAQKTPFKLRFNELSNGDKLYRVDVSSHSVMEEKRIT